MRLYDVRRMGAIFITEQISEIMIFHPFGRNISMFKDYKFFAATIGENVMGGTYTDAQKKRR